MSTQVPFSSNSGAFDHIIWSLLAGLCSLPRSGEKNTIPHELGTLSADEDHAIRVKAPKQLQCILRWDVFFKRKRLRKDVIYDLYVENEKSDFSSVSKTYCAIRYKYKTAKLYLDTRFKMLSPAGVKAASSYSQNCDLCRAEGRVTSTLRSLYLNRGHIFYNKIGHQCPERVTLTCVLNRWD